MKQILPAFLVAFFTIAFVACNKTSVGDGACGNGKSQLSAEEVTYDATYKTYTGAVPPDGEVHIAYNGDSVQFIMGRAIAGVCSKEHLNIEFGATFDDNADSFVHVYGEAYYGVSNRAVQIYSGTANPLIVKSAMLEVGLAQQFPDKPADVDLYITVTFKRHATQDQDIKYFKLNIERIFIKSNYSDH